MSGVLTLSLSTVIVKIIGLAYKIPMIGYLGAEGMGYFNSAYEIYALLCVIATAGLPTALTMLISEARERGERKQIERTYRTALLVFLLLGALGSTLMVWLARPLAEWIGNNGAHLCILAIAPALFCVCFAGAVRGYFQGFGKMTPTAISQLLEALGKLVFGVLFAALALQRGNDIPTVAAFAVLGLSLGTLVSALYLLLAKVIGRSGRAAIEAWRSEANSPCFSTLLRIAVPITLSSAVLSVTRLLDMALIMRRLQTIGWSAAEANAVYGAYTTLAVPVFGLLPSLITPISLALVPQLAGAVEGGDAEEQATVADRALRLTILLSMPASMGITLYAYPILSLLFRSEPEAVAVAAPLLAILGMSVLFSGIITTTNAILQAYHRVGAPILSMTVGALVKALSAYVLLGIPQVGVYGAPISTLLCNITVTVINMRLLAKCLPHSIHATGFFGLYGKPLGASAGAILASLAVYIPLWRISDRMTLSFLGAVLVAVVGYMLFAVWMGVVTSEDIALLPLGKRLAGHIGYNKKTKIQSDWNKKEGKNNDGRGKNSVSFKQEDL